MNDTVELAKRFAAGLSLKRGETISMVKELLELLDAKEVQIIAPENIGSSFNEFVKEELVGPVVEKETAPEVNNGYQEVLYGLVSQFEKRAPLLRVTVEKTPEGAVYVGPDVNRVYSKDEAVALAGRLYRVAQ